MKAAEILCAAATQLGIEEMTFPPREGANGAVAEAWLVTRGEKVWVTVVISHEQRL
jgi:hypothetical protein